MLKRKFLINGFWLTATTLIARTMGMFFRVYMSNSIGAEALGLYQLVLTVYFFVVTFATSGISLIVTRLVTESLAKNEGGRVKFVITRCILISLILSLTAAVVLYSFSQPIGLVLLGDKRTILSLKVLAPSLPFMAVSACLRGYFYARRTALKTASEQLLEQVIEMGVFALLVVKMSSMGIEYACCAVAIGTTTAEVISCFYSALLYKLDLKNLNAKTKKYPKFYSKAAAIGVPVMLSSCLRAGLSTLENLMIPKGLKSSGSSYEKSLTDYGMITGMVMPVLTFPSVFLYSFSMLIIPEVTEAHSTMRTKGIQYMTKRILRFIFLFSIPIAVIFCFFSGELGILIYSSNEIGVYICLLAPIVPILYLDAVVDGLLKGLNEQLHYLSYNLIDSFVKIILILFLLPKFGIMGLIIVMYSSAIINTGLSLMRLLKVTDVTIKIFSWVFKPAVCCIIPCLIITLVPKVYFISLFWGTIIKLIFVVLVYLILIKITGTLKKEEEQWVKGIFKN